VFNATFNNISFYTVVVTFIGGGNRSTRRKARSAASHWQFLPHNVESSASHHERDSNSKLLVVLGTDW